MELVLVDGGSSDDTCQYIKDLNHPRIKLIEVGRRSPYPHYMNEGIKASSGEWIAQWNDEVTLIGGWSKVFRTLREPFDAFVFVWKRGHKAGPWINYCNWKNEMVMNYGIYNRRIFKEIGMYNHAYQYYCCDGDMLFRTWKKGYRIKVCEDIHVVEREGEKKQAIHDMRDFAEYDRREGTYSDGKIPETVEFLK